MKRVLLRHGLAGLLLAAWAGPAAISTLAAPKMSGISGHVEAFQFATGLKGPDGIALHPETGDLYVAERDAGRISVIKNGTPSAVIESGFTVDEDFPKWTMNKTKTKEFLMEGKLVSPGSIAITQDGTIYVAEDREFGRVLEFKPDEQGKYTKANLIAVPWLDKPFAWDDLKVSKTGELYLVGYDKRGEGTLHFGTVLVRATDGDWWVIDYGPFSSFASFTLSRNHDILVVAERTKGEIVAWDLERHLPIGTVPESVFKAEAGSNCLLKDGSYIIAEVPLPENQGSKGNSRLVRVDPVTAQATGIAEGFDMIGSVILDPKTGHMFVSDQGAGIIAELAVDEGLLAKEYLLQRSLEAFESSAGFSPRVAPAFLKNFLSRIGGPDTGERPSSQEAGGQEQGTPQEDVLYSSSFTLREFATKIPLVAGKVRTLLDDDVTEENPVTQIDFLLFFPSHVVKSTDMATPSLSFFSATRKNGDVEQSRLLFNNLHATQRVGDQWLLQTDTASIYVPIATCGMDRNEEGMDLNLAFLGMGIYDDFYLQLTTGKENYGSLMVEGKYGGSSEYRLSFVDAPKIGGEMVKNLVVAGFDPASAGEELGWLNIGQWPVGSALALEDQQVVRFAGAGEEVSEAIEKKELERRMELGSEAEDASGATPNPPASDAPAPAPQPPPEQPATPAAAETPAAENAP